MVTGAVLTDLSAAHDTVNNWWLRIKIYDRLPTTALWIMQSFLEKLTILCLHRKRTWWWKQKNGLYQGSIFAPVLVNLYTNDQPIHTGMRSFIHADYVCTTAQAKNFAQVEAMLASVLNGLWDCHIKNELHINLNKIEISLFYLCNQNTSWQLSLIWNRITVAYYPNPIYSGVTLDCVLSHKGHVD